MNDPSTFTVRQSRLKGTVMLANAWEILHDPHLCLLADPEVFKLGRFVLSDLYRNPTGPALGSTADISYQSSASNRDLTHAFSLCDRHRRRILGRWYSCAFCTKDLCVDCEWSHTHNSTHLFLAFKVPVDIQAFRSLRRFADLENPAGSPVLYGNIYY
ncbi:hypothetical protein EI94DRAFT_1319436 [Lactarius quietus]|nr:hypothetical protein EI94DRAFT_1319436 [Lactarius quietus]